MRWELILTVILLSYRRDSGHSLGIYLFYSQMCVTSLLAASEDMYCIVSAEHETHMWQAVLWLKV